MRSMTALQVQQSTSCDYADVPQQPKAMLQGPQHEVSRSIYATLAQHVDCGLEEQRISTHSLLN